MVGFLDLEQFELLWRYLRLGLLGAIKYLHQTKLLVGDAAALLIEQLPDLFMIDSRHRCFCASLYYRVVVIRAPLQGLCYTVRDAVD